MQEGQDNIFSFPLSLSSYISPVFLHIKSLPLPSPTIPLYIRHFPPIYTYKWDSAVRSQATSGGAWPQNVSWRVLMLK